MANARRFDAFTLHPHDKERLSPLSGIGVDTLVKNQRQSFRENSLFTDRGISGTANLQISSYWQPGGEIEINLLPTINLAEHLKHSQKETPQKQLNSILTELLPKRVVEVFIDEVRVKSKLHAISYKEFEALTVELNHWQLKPNGTEGYRAAEVTLGGVDCDAISSKTFEANEVPGLYFIGEVLDVTGWLGGYNFQWAWSPGWATGQVV